MTRPRRIAIVAAVVVMTSTLSAVGSSASPTAHRGQRITLTTTTCAAHWYAPNPGRRTFEVVNNSAFTATVYLFHPVSDGIVATVRDLSAHATREISATIRRGGHYMWGCDLNGRPPRTSDAETAPVDPVRGGQGQPVVPLTRDQLAVPMKAYRPYVAAQLERVEGQVSAMATAIDNDDLATAESKWLAAHQSWLRIGQDDGPYSAFGNRGQVIDGLAAGLVKGTADPQFTGFHKVELDLWTDNDLKAAAHDTARLLIAVSQLSEHGVAHWFPLDNDSVSSLPLRCHEVLEDALRDSLSGDDDYGSGTSLASVKSDVTATRELLKVFAPLLEPRAPHLVPTARRELTRLDAALIAARSGTTWTPVTALGRAKREAIDSAVGGALETLAPIPDLLTTGKS